MDDQIATGSEHSYSSKEREARDRAFLASDGFTPREGRLWNEAWDAARRFYAPNAANTLAHRLGLEGYRS